jgi:hypothetical protein
MKTLNSEAIMDLDLIRRLGITYLSVEDKFAFESCVQKAMNFQIALLITRKVLSCDNRDVDNLTTFRPAVK